MKANIDTLMLFPTPVHIIRYEDTSFCDVYAQKLLSYVDHERLNKRFIWTSSDDLETNVEFSHIRNMIEYESSEVFKTQNLNPSDFKLSCMWANVHKNGGKHHIHQHPNSYLSGVLYLSAPENNTGKLMLIDPRPAKTMIYPDFSDSSVMSDRGYYIKPQKGMMVLFPSWLEHGTEYVDLNDDEYRICISFNYQLMRSTMKTGRF